MKLYTLRLKRTVSVALVVLLLNAVGLTKAFTQSFTVGDLNYSFNSDGVSVTMTDHVDGTAATGELVIPETVTYERNDYAMNTIANDGYIFTNWAEGSNVVSTSSNYPFTVTSDRALVANFTESSNNMLILSNESGADGSTVTMSVDLVNVEDFSAFQFDIVMNEHISYVEGSAALTERATPNHILIAQLINNGTILRVLCYSMPATNFVGNSGPIVTFDLVITGEAGVTYTVDLNNPIISTMQGQQLEVIAIDGSVTIVPGDFYTITTTANPAEGGTVTGAGTFEEGALVTVTAIANDGYSFTNWTENGVVVSTSSTYSFTVTSDRALVANFTPTSVTTYTITASANPTEGGTVTGAGVYNEGTIATLVATEASGFTFTNWTEGGNVVSTSSTYSFTVTSDRALVANFTINTYNVTVAANPSNGGSVSGGGTYNYGATCTLTATANTGYSFTNWTKNGQQVSTSATYSFTVTESGNYIANFSLNSYTITASANPSNGGSVNGGGNYYYGATCTLTATANTGYTFINWTKNGQQVSTSASYSFTVTESGNYVANFSLNSYTITASANPSNGGSVNGGGNYYYGATCTLTATANTGYTFINWTKNGTVVSTNPTYSFTVTESGNYVANFELNSYTITASANPSNGGSVSGGGNYYYGATCTLTATANTGYTFTNWTKNGQQVSTSVTYSFTVTESGNYVANFELNSYTITAIANPTESGTVTGAGTYNHGATATLIATANTGYIFINWTKDGTVISTNPTYSFTVTEDVDLVANFEVYNGIGKDNITYNSLYPNPTNGMITVEAEKISEIVISNMMGQIVARYTDINASSTNIDMNSYEKGTYLVRIITDSSVIVRNVVKM